MKSIIIFMTKEEKFLSCKAFFEEAVARLSNYELVKSCNQDCTMYLVPEGTSDQITYQSKPAHSLRFSDHWNWYSNTEKCPNERYIQCLCFDLPYAHKRKAPGKASRPIEAVAVAVTDEKGIYKVVFGEVYDKKTKTWSWKQSSAQDIFEALRMEE